MKKFFKKLIIASLIIFLLIIGSGLVVTFFYQKEVTNAVLAEINKHIDTKINVNKVEFSVLKKFPDASIEFKNVVAMSTADFKGISTYEDTLFTAKSLFLQFNVLDILKKIYILKAIHIENADIRIITNSNGNENFRFWHSDSSSASNFSLKLNSVKLVNTKVTYINRIKNSDIRLSTDNFKLSGDFSSDSYILKSKGSFYFKKLKINKVNYATKNNISLNADIKVNNQSLEIKNGKLKAEDLLFLISGNADFSDKLKLNLSISGKDINLKSLISTIPKKYATSFSKYKSEGLFYINGKITGELSNYESPHLIADFGISKGVVKNIEHNIELYDVYLKGSWTNGKQNSNKTSELQIDTLNAKMNNSVISGYYKMSNFIHPKINTKIKLDADVNEFISFLNIDTVENAKGRIVSNVYFAGNFNDLSKITNQEISYAKKSGKVLIKNTSLKIKGVDEEIKDISGEFSFNNKNIEISYLKFIQGVNDIEIKGFLYNLFDYLLIENKDLRVSGSLKSHNLDLEKLLIYSSANTNATNSDINYSLDKSINYRLDFYVDNIKFRKFTGKNLRGNYKYYQNKVTLDDFSIETMDGNITGNLSIAELDSANFKVNVSSNLKNVDINKMMFVFDNFGQNFIVNENLKGKISSKSKVSFNMDNHLKINQKSIVAEVFFIIVNGELIKYKPIYSLSKYIELEELEDIKFSKLENRLYIKNEKLYIPKMTINSNAFNIDLEGEQSFNGDYDYHIKILLSEILANKAKKAKNENTEFGVVEDDGLGKTSLYLSVISTNGKVKVKYDKKKARENLSNKVKEEKTNVKTILNEEFGWFKKDSTIVKKKNQEKNEPKKKKKKVQIQWDDN